MGIFNRKINPSRESHPTDSPSLSGWNQWSDVKSFSLWIVFLLLLAFSTYYLSRPDPAELQNRAMKVMNELRQLQEQKASDAQSLSLLLTQVEQEENRNFTRGIWQHLSHALFVACILILAVEVHTRRATRKDMQRHVDDVTRNVFQGVSQRLLGEGISSELKSILREDFVKQRAGYQLTFEGSPDGNSDWVIVRQESWYDVRNLTREPEDFPFRTSLLGYHKRKVTVNGKQMEFPCFVSVTIDDEDCPLTELQDAKNPDPFTLRKKIPFSKDLLSVKVVTRLLYRPKDSVVLSSTYGMEQSEVTVSNEAANLVGKCEAVVLHKHTEQVKPRTSGQWEFSRALLPGQGWYVYWEQKDTQTPSSQGQSSGGNDQTVALSNNHTTAHSEPPTTTKV
jgi:hypothetical protein